MKKILLFLFTLIYVIGYSQSQESDYMVPDSTAAFLRPLSAGKKVLDFQSKKLWILDSAVVKTQSLSTSYKTLLASSSAITDTGIVRTTGTGQKVHQSLELLETSKIKGLGSNVDTTSYGYAVGGSSVTGSSFGVSMNGSTIAGSSYGVAFGGGSIQNLAVGISAVGGLLDNSYGYAFDGGQITNNSRGISFNGGTINNSSQGIAFNASAIDSSSHGFSFNGGTINNSSRGIAFNGSAIDSSSHGIAFGNGLINGGQAAISYNKPDTSKADSVLLQVGTGAFSDHLRLEIDGSLYLPATQALSSDSILTIDGGGKVGYKVGGSFDTTAIYNELATKWTHGGDSVTFPNNYIGTLGDANLRIGVNGVNVIYIDSLHKTVSVNGALSNATTHFQVASATPTIVTNNIPNVDLNMYAGASATMGGSVSISRNRGTIYNTPFANVSGDLLGAYIFRGTTIGATPYNIGGVYGFQSTLGTSRSTGNAAVRLSVSNTATIYNNIMYFNGALGYVGISNGVATNAPTTPTYNLSMASGAAATWGIEPSASGAGVAWTLRSSGAASGATDGNGGMFTAAYGKSTGTGFGSFRVTRYSRAISTGTAGNTESDAMIIPSSKLMADNTSTDLFNVACADGTSAGVTVEYTIKTVGGAGNESHTEVGTLYIMASNDGAVTLTVTKTTSAQHKSDAGTYTVTFAATTASPSVISVTADTDLNVNSVIHYNIINKDAQVINQL